MSNDVLVYDIETRTYGKPDPEKDKLKIFGCYSYRTNKYYMLTKIDDIQRVINAHRFLVGFNNEKYDNPIIEREGLNLKYKIIIDLMDVVKKRAGIMKIKEGMLKDLLMTYSLDYVTQILKLVDNDSSKIKIDYKIFQKDNWTKEEMQEILVYTKRDIEVTKKLYEWLENYFSAFKDFINVDDINKKKYLTDTPAAFTYKVLCKELGLKPEFDNSNESNEEESYKGGYVAYPAGERFENNLVLFDFASLYPNIFIQCNLFSSKCDCCTTEEKWHGNGFFKVNGYYCTKKLGRIEELYKKLFLLRKEYIKNKDPKNYTLKIVLNTGYGVTGNSKFKQLYNRDAASDCTAVGRQCILYVRKRFREEGYINVFTDTDSICVQIPKGKILDDATKLAEQIVKELQQYMPFPW